MSHMKDAAIDAHNAGHDVTDLSKLSSDEIIGKIAGLVMDFHGLGASEAIAKLHVLTVILKQVVIREASAGEVSIKTDGKLPYYPYVDKLILKGKGKHGWMEYDLIPKETP